MNTLRCDRHPLPAHRAVSLFEVVVSTAAVSVALTVLLPALGEARRQSKEMHCLSNLRRLSDASAVFATGHPDELVIPVHDLVGQVPGALGQYEWGGKSGIGEPLGPGPATSKWGTQFSFGPGSRRLNPIIYKGGFTDYANDPGPNQINWLNDTRLDLDVYRCPADYGYSGSHFTAWRDSGLSSFDHYGNSYTTNTQYIGLSGPDCRLWSNSPFMRPMSRMVSPSRTVLYLENCGRFGWRQNYGIDGCGSLFNPPPSVDTIIRGWHNAPFTFNVAYVDGHVSRTIMNGHIHPQPHLGRYPDDFGGNPTQQYSFWRCVIIRGLDWQLDTLPAPPIRTNIPCSRVSGNVVISVGD